MEKEKKVRTLCRLFLTMLKIGLFTFGGGYAMISLLQDEFVEKKKWMENDEFLDMVAIAESTPGPIAINSATHIGYKAAGVLGSAVATVGVCIPSFVIIYLIALFFDAFLGLELVARAFKGIQAGVVFLILRAGVKMLRQQKKSPVGCVILTLTVGVMVAFSVFAVKFSSVFYILISAAVGLTVYGVSLLRKGKEDKK